MPRNYMGNSKAWELPEMLKMVTEVDKSSLHEVVHFKNCKSHAPLF
jgi:hypothetical protein